MILPKEKQAFMVSAMKSGSEWKNSYYIGAYKYIKKNGECHFHI